MSSFSINPWEIHAYYGTLRVAFASRRVQLSAREHAQSTREMKKDAYEKKENFPSNFL